MKKQTTDTIPPGGKLVAWIGFVFGSLASIAGNVLASRLPPPHAPADWTPSLFAQIGATVWPIGLLLAVEILSRVRWPSGLIWSLTRYGGVVAVALGSAVISYSHTRAVLLSWNYDPIGAGVGPLVLDGLMVVAGVALLANATHHAVPTPAVDPVPAAPTLDISGQPRMIPDVPPVEAFLDPVPDPVPTPSPLVTASARIDETPSDPDRFTVPDPRPAPLTLTRNPQQSTLDLDPLDRVDPGPVPVDPDRTPFPTRTPTGVVTAPIGHDPDPDFDPALVEIAHQVFNDLTRRGQRPTRDLFVAELRERSLDGQKIKIRTNRAGALLQHVRELVAA